LTTKELREKEREEKRKIILDAASEIIAKEGVENLSIRKIANKIEYSPAIIYHYFDDKEDILNNWMKIGYKRIMQSVQDEQYSSFKPKERLKKRIKNYIELSLGMPDEYKSILLNNSREILKHTSVLDEGASNKRQAMAILCQNLKDIYKDKYDNKSIELIAQVIWTSTFGLITRLIIENDVSDKQRNNLIDYHIKFIINGIVEEKSI
jgi:AcrR family transcriptional regulator